MLPVLLCLVLLVSPIRSVAQEVADTGPQLPVVLEWADSLVTTALGGSTQREFLGHVRFRQGNVTVTCDRAIHDQAANGAELFGNVVVTQDGLTMKAPYARYDGNSFIASATRGLTVKDGHRTLTARSGEYSTKTHVAVFVDQVQMFDDTARVWADRVVYDRDTKFSTAIGRVVVRDTIRRAIIAGDTIHQDPATDHSIILGEAALWQWETDTMLVVADTLEAFRGADERFIAQGNAALVRGGVAARADSMYYSDSTGRFDLLGMPLLWADSMQLFADTVIVIAPDRSLREIHGLNDAIMISRNDTLLPARYDQVSGRYLRIDVERDTVRSLLAVDDARSITFRSEEGVRDGLAKFASDTIKGYFDQGQPSDIYWLGGVEGEHHPEKSVEGRENEFLLPGFEWRVDRPTLTEPPAPYTDRTKRQGRLPRAGYQIQATTGKKK